MGRMNNWIAGRSPCLDCSLVEESKEICLEKCNRIQMFQEFLDRCELSNRNGSALEEVSSSFSGRTGWKSGD